MPLHVLKTLLTTVARSVRRLRGGGVSNPVPRTDVYADALIREAQLLHQNGALDGAQALCLQALEAQPNSVDAHFFLGRLALETQRYDLAAKHISHALRLRPETPVFHDTMGMIRYAQGQLYDATGHYRNALALDTSNASTMFNLALTLLFRLDFVEAKALFERAAATDRGFIQALRTWGDQLIAQDKPEMAEVVLAAALVCEPGDLPTLQALGVALLNQEKIAGFVAVQRDMARAKLAAQPPGLPAHAHPVPISNTTLCCVDTCNHDLAIHALQRCMAQCSFEKVLFFTDRDLVLDGIDVIRVDGIRSFLDYSRFMIKELNAYIATDFALIVQYDGFIIDATQWDERFKHYDYIGARWNAVDENSVGNGGFSLRSKRLLAALQDPRITEFDPEDAYICDHYRELLESRHGIRFAPGKVADAFSFDGVPRRSSTFGFHGICHLVALIGLDSASAAQYTGGVMRTIEYER